MRATWQEYRELGKIEREFRTVVRRAQFSLINQWASENPRKADLVVLALAVLFFLAAQVWGLLFDYLAGIYS